MRAIVPSAPGKLHESGFPSLLLENPTFRSLPCSS